MTSNDDCSSASWAGIPAAGSDDDYIPTCRDCGTEICTDQMDVGLCVDCETGRPDLDAGIGRHLMLIGRNAGRS